MTVVFIYFCWLLDIVVSQGKRDDYDDVSGDSEPEENGRVRVPVGKKRTVTTTYHVDEEGRESWATVDGPIDINRLLTENFQCKSYYYAIL